MTEVYDAQGRAVPCAAVYGGPCPRYGNLQNHKETRDRKLLLKRKELNKLLKNKLKGMTIVPTELFVNDKGLIKLNIALSKGKKCMINANLLRIVMRSENYVKFRYY